MCSLRLLVSITLTGLIVAADETINRSTANATSAENQSERRVRQDLLPASNKLFNKTSSEASKFAINRKAANSIQGNQQSNNENRRKSKIIQFERGKTTLVSSAVREFDPDDPTVQPIHADSHVPEENEGPVYSEELTKPNMRTNDYYPVYSEQSSHEHNELDPEKPYYGTIRIEQDPEKSSHESVLRELLPELAVLNIPPKYRKPFIADPIYTLLQTNKKSRDNAPEAFFSEDEYSYYPENTSNVTKNSGNSSKKVLQDIISPNNTTDDDYVWYTTGSPLTTANLPVKPLILEDITTEESYQDTKTDRPKLDLLKNNPVIILFPYIMPYYPFPPNLYNNPPDQTPFAHNPAPYAPNPVPFVPNGAPYAPNPTSYTPRYPYSTAPPQYSTPIPSHYYRPPNKRFPPKKNIYTRKRKNEQQNAQRDGVSYTVKIVYNDEDSDYSGIPYLPPNRYYRNPVLPKSFHIDEIPPYAYTIVAPQNDRYNLLSKLEALLTNRLAQSKRIDDIYHDIEYNSNDGFFH